MSGLGLARTEERQLLQQATPGNGDDAGLFSGVLGAVPEGIASGALRAAAPLAAESIDEGFNPLLGALGGGLPEQYTPEKPGAGLTDAEFEAQRRAALGQTFESFRPDPRTTGFAGQLLFGLSDMFSRFAAGTALAGPVGGATLAGVSEGYAVTAEQIAAGVDPETARQVGVVQGGAAFVGGIAPVSVGVSTVAKVSTGAALNVLVGGVSRGTTSAVLSANGYEKQASQYKWLDTQALLTDAVLGAGFGYVSSPHARVVGEQLFSGVKPTPEQVAAAAVANQQNHLEIQTAPGVTIDPPSRDAHVDNLVRSSEALMADEAVPSLRDVSVIENPEARAFSREVERVAREPLERRFDAETRARIEDMTPEQQVSEIRWLREENQRLTNERATDPLTGLGNKVAWAKLEQDASLPVKAMLDVDSLKWVNDNLGHEAGDAYLVQIGEAIKRAGAENAVRLGGDEFAFASRTPEAADAISARINEELGRVRVEATTPTGEVITKTGAGISYGRGANRREADVNLYRNKQERTDQGLRGERGAEPSGVSRQPAARQQGTVSATGTEADGGGRDAGPPDDGEPVNAAARSAEDLGAAAVDDAATAILAEQPDLTITLEDGSVVRADEALAEADAVVAQARADAKLYDVAVSCFLGNGL